MKLAIPHQAQDGETRVAMDPATTARLVKLGLEVTIEAGAGLLANHDDDAYRKAGAAVAEGDAFHAAWADADALLVLTAPTVQQAQSVKSGSTLIGMLQPLANTAVIAALKDRGATAFSMEFVPRISRAQSMDVLSSQANIGGYMAVILAARSCPRIFPMMITAAGTIAPARVFVLGAGVAGLQATATAKRLGAVVEAYDIRPEVEEQVQSLGARFVKLPTTKKDASAAGGYAKEQSDEERKQQVQLMTKHVAAADAVITTAAVFGKAPPMLVPADMVNAMQRGAVLVDLAADARAGRGNCERTRPGERYVTEQGVCIDGTLNLPSLAPIHASQMYAANMLAFLKLIVKDKQLSIDFEDEILKGACICHGHEIRNELVRKAMGN